MSSDQARPRRDLRDFDLDMLVAAMTNLEGGYFEPGTSEATLIVDGEVLGAEDDIDPEETNWMEVPVDDSRRAYRDMAEFAASVSDVELAARLTSALEGAKAFRRFRDTIGRDDRHRSLWPSFRDARLSVRAIQWLLDEDLVEATGALAALDALHDEAEALLAEA